MGPAENSGETPCPAGPARRQLVDAPTDVDEYGARRGVVRRERAHDAALLDDEPARVVVRSLQHRDRRGERQVRVARQRDRVVGGRPVPGEARRVRRARIEAGRLASRRRWRWRWRSEAEPAGGSLGRVPSPLLHACRQTSASSKAAHLAALFSRPAYGASYMDSPQDDAIADAIRAAKCRGAATRSRRRGPPSGMRAQVRARMLPNAIQPTSRADRTPRQRRRVPGEHAAGTALCVRARCAPSRFRRPAVGRPPSRAAQRFEPATHRRRRSQCPGNDVGRVGGDRGYRPTLPPTTSAFRGSARPSTCWPAMPTATAFVELKRASLRAFGHEAVVRKVCEVLKPVARQCVLVSADFAAVHHVRQVSPYRIGWRLSEYTNTAALKCEALAPDYLFCDHQLLTRERLEAVARPVALGRLRRADGEAGARARGARRAAGRDQRDPRLDARGAAEDVGLKSARGCRSGFSPTPNPMYCATWRSAQLSLAKLSMKPQ